MNWSLIFHFVRQDLVEKYSGSVLGRFWTLLLPLINILIFTLVFAKIMGAKLALFDQEFSEYSYSIYLVSGLLAWNAFAATIQRVSQVFHDKAGIIAKIQLSLRFLPLYVLLSESIIYLISMAFFVCFLLLIGFPISEHWLLLPVIYVAQQFFAYALGFTLAIFGVFLRDVRELVGVLLQLWFWLTPIVYVLNIVPESAHWFFYLNPATALMDAYRSVILFQQPPELLPLGLVAIVATGLALFGFWLLSRLEKDIRDFL